MDHRSVKEAQFITDSKHPALDQVGGVCSPEFTMAKLLWLKKNEPHRFEKAIAFFELPDYLTWRCLQSSDFTLDLFKPSNCSTTCKWGYDGENKEWPKEFYDVIGLGSILDNIDRIGG